MSRKSPKMLFWISTTQKSNIGVRQYSYCKESKKNVSSILSWIYRHPLKIVAGLEIKGN